MPPTITSAANPHIKRLRKLLTSAKARREEQLAIAEGIHLVESFLQTGTTPDQYICAQSALGHPEVKALIEQLAQTTAQAIVVSNDIFSSLSSVHASVGIMIVFTPSQPAKFPETFTQTAVLLEDIQDPGNIGAILRVIAATGLRQVFLSPDCASVWSPKALRAGMGAQFSLMLYEEVDLLALAKRSDIPVLATTLSGQSQSLYTLDLTHPVLWTFGNEGQGVSQQLINLATTHVLIPQATNTVESLNVAIAAAVCLYEQFRQTA